MDKLWGHYTKWNKADRGREISYDLSYLWNVKEKQKKLIEIEKRLVVARGGGWGVGEMGQGGQRVKKN